MLEIGPDSIQFVSDKLAGSREHFLSNCSGEASLARWKGERLGGNING